jgi:hypothetical protein
MSADPDPLEDLVGSVMDGHPVDWAGAESGATSEYEQLSITALRDVSRIAQFNRDLQRPGRAKSARRRRLDGARPRARPLSLGHWKPRARRAREFRRPIEPSTPVSSAKWRPSLAGWRRGCERRQSLPHRGPGFADRHQCSHRMEPTSTMGRSIRTDFVRGLTPADRRRRPWRRQIAAIGLDPVGPERRARRRPVHGDARLPTR